MNIFSEYNKLLTDLSFTILSFDKHRPWGGFFVIAEEQAQAFANQYFDGLDVSTLKRAESRTAMSWPMRRLKKRRNKLRRLLKDPAAVLRFEKRIQDYDQMIL